MLLLQSRRAVVRGNAYYVQIKTFLKRSCVGAKQNERLGNGGHVFRYSQ